MSEIGKEQLKTQINDILKDADLSAWSSKKVRLELEERLGKTLSHRKEEIDELVKEYVDAQDDGSEDEKSEEDGTEEEEEEKKKPTKRPAPAAKKNNAKKSKKESDSEDEESEPEEGSNDSDDDSYPPKKPVPKKKAPKRKSKGSDSDSDSDWGKGNSGGGRGGARKSGGAAKGKGYTRAYKLSPQLGALMGKDSMARHEVVKKMWALIKERNLFDPNNKQFAICDDDVFRVIGVKRFRTFGMMKYLKSHFRD